MCTKNILKVYIKELAISSSKLQTTIMILRRIADCFYHNQRHFTTKLSIILLLWHFSTSFLYNILLRQPSYFQLDNTNIGILTATFLKTPFLFSPLAGFLADARFGRMKVLLFGTYSMITATFLSVKRQPEDKIDQLVYMRPI